MNPEGGRINLFESVQRQTLDVTFSDDPHEYINNQEIKVFKQLFLKHGFAKNYYEYILCGFL